MFIWHSNVWVECQVLESDSPEFESQTCHLPTLSPCVFPYLLYLMVIWLISQFNLDFKLFKDRALA